MAKPKPEKNLAAAAPPTRVLPMQLRIGDRVSDGRTWWQVIGQPNMTARGNTVHVLVESVKQRGVTDIRSWGARERVEVERRRRAMRWVHEYNGWRFGLIALEQDRRWTARIEVYEPRRASREQSPVSLPFDTWSSSPERILVRARIHTQAWIRRQQSSATKRGRTSIALRTAR
jgi:hypothetical protein